MLSRSPRPPNLQLVTYGGMRWGLPFLVRRTVLLGLAPSVPLPLGRRRLETHFDVDAVLGNWDARRSRPLELAALQYELPGPWSDYYRRLVPTVGIQNPRTHALKLAF
jgi:hypothetical protein